MATVHEGRYTADVEDEIVVFLIGMRINRPWKVHKWAPMAQSMPRMLQDLFAHPEKGLLAARFAWIGGPAVVQYWRSFADLERFARAPEDPHLPAWRWYNGAVKASGDVGIWHETYRVPAGNTESIYGNMPKVGLAAATRHVPVRRRGQSAAYRMGTTDTDEPVLTPYETPE
ncbi:MAG: DUF4188 domain-containing protein [Egibacteraceae bacterium]